MGIYISNIEKPKRCIEEVEWGLLDSPCIFVDDRNACLLQDDSKMGEYEENYKTCPLIEIDHTNTELLEFFNEFKKWKASKEVAKYINAVYGERRADETNSRLLDDM